MGFGINHWFDEDDEVAGASMERPLAYLKKRDDNWLIGYSRQFTQLAELYLINSASVAQRNSTENSASWAQSSAISSRFHRGLCSWLSRFPLQSQLGKTGMATSLGASSTRLDWGMEIGDSVRDYYPNPQPQPSPNGSWFPLVVHQVRFALPSTPETLMASVRGFQQYFQLNQVNSLCVLPLYHVSGLMQFLRSFTTGGSLVILPFKQLSDGQRCNIDLAFFISLVPTQLQRFFRESSANQLAIPIWNSATRWRSSLVYTSRTRRRGHPVSPTYGMTETASDCHLKTWGFLSGTNCGQVYPMQSNYSHFYRSSVRCKPNRNHYNRNSLALGYYQSCLPTRYFQLDDLGFVDYLNIVGRSSNKIVLVVKMYFHLKLNQPLERPSLLMMFVWLAWLITSGDKS